MKLLGDVELYCIKVDYFMYSDEKGEYTEPNYLCIDTELKKKDGTPVNLIVFSTEITPNLRVFDTYKEAEEYIESRLSNTCSCENNRVVKIKYDYHKGIWKEVM